MIYDKCSNINKYFRKESTSCIIEFFKKDLNKLENGRYDLENGIYIVKMEYDANAEWSKFEAHKKFIDLQCILVGKEGISFAPISEAKEVVSYDEAKDIAFYDVDGQDVILSEGYFAGFFPWDAHRAGKLVCDKCNKITKILVKIPIEKY